MADITSPHRELVSSAIDGEGRASRAMRRSAFNNDGLEEPINTLVSKVALNAKSITDEDFRAVRAAGLSEEVIFEIVVCAAIGQATRQYEAGLEALRAATGQV